MVDPRSRSLIYVLALIGFLAFGLDLGLRRARLDAAVTTTAPVLRTRQPHPAPPQNEKIDLRLGLDGQSQRRLTSGVVHRYRLPLKPGQLLHALVDQNVVEDDAIDLVVELYRPDGMRLYQIDSLTFVSGSEEIFLVADVPGTYRVEIDGLGREGTYHIRVLSVHPANHAERLNALAERVFYESRELALMHPPRVGEALAGFQKAARLWQSLGRPERRAEALRRCGSLLSAQRSFKLAEVFHRQALRLFRVTGNHAMEAEQLVSIGISRKGLGDLEAAEESYRTAIRIAHKYGHPGVEANALHNLGILLQQEGDSWGALDACETALALARRNEKEELQELGPLLQVGQILASLGKLQTALTRYEEALQVLGSRRNPDQRARILSRISELYLYSGDFSRALSYARLALNYRVEADDSRGKAVTLAGMSLILQQMGDLKQARVLQEQALAIFHRIGDLPSEGIARLNLGHLWLAQRDVRKASAHFDQALLLFRQQGLKEGEMATLYESAEAQRLRGNPEAARRQIEAALAVLDSLSGKAVGDELKKIYLAARQKSYGLLIDLLVKSPPQTTTEREIATSFETSERARWQQLADSLTPGRIRARVLKRADPSQMAERRRLEDKINRVEEERLRFERDGQSSLAIRKTQAALMEELRILDTRLRRKDPWATNSSRPAPISLQETQELLDQDSVLLEYHLGDRRSFLWLVTPLTAEVLILPARRAIEERARRLHQLLSKSQWSANQREAIPLARELSAILLGPVADRLVGRAIIVIPDGAIHLVPFTLLPDPAGAAGIWKHGWPQPLFLAHRVSYLPSALVLRAIRREHASRRPAAGQLAVLADPVFTDPTLPHLSLTRWEASAILSLVPPGQGSLRALGIEASLELAMSGKLGGYRIVHFATHATNHPEHSELSSIVLSQTDGQGRSREGHLRLQNIQDLELPADLVVLSACKTALGRDIRGEGYMGLTQGFLYAGATRVLVSLWNVSEESTPRLMEHFYRALLIERKSPAEALRAAQRWLAEETPWSSPYYWAGFELHGEWR